MMKKYLLPLLLLAAPAMAQIPAQAQAPAAAPAPAPAAAAVPDWMAYKNPYAKNTQDLAIAHRTSEEVLAWSAQAVANSLSFDKGGFDARVREVKGMFLQTGWAGYVDHLKASGLIDEVRAKGNAVTTAATGEPRILRSGTMQGAWRWEVAVPVLTSLMREGSDGRQQAFSGTRTEIDLLLVHVPEDGSKGGTDGIAIESWTRKQVAAK